MVCSLGVFGASAGDAQTLGGPGPAKPDRPTATGSATGDPSLQFTSTIASDYVNRGVSQTSGGPQFEAGLEAGVRGFYAGVTAFHVDFAHLGDRVTNAEIDLYGGYSTLFKGQAVDVGVIRYDYTPSPARAAALDYTEVYAKTARAFGPATLAGSLYYSGNGMSAAGPSWYGVVSGSWKLDDRWSASGLVGRQTMRSGGGYDDWNAGVTYALTKSLNLDLRYWNTSRHALGPDYGDRVVLGVAFNR